MSDPLTPNYKKNVGRLATDRFDFQDHVDGYSFRHEAGQIDLVPSLVIDGDVRTTVQDAVSALSGIISAPVVPDATSSVKGILKLAGDLGGIADSVTVTGIRNHPINISSPSNNDVLTWNGSVWTNLPINTFTPGGDLGGTYLSQTVEQISGNAGNVLINVENFVIDAAMTGLNISFNSTSSSSGSDIEIYAQSSTYPDPSAKGGNLYFGSGSSTSYNSGSVSLLLGSSVTHPFSFIGLELAEIGSGRRILSLLNRNPITTEMPAGTGDGVMFIRNAQTSPSTGNPVNGAILYADSGTLKVRESSGNDFTLGGSFTAGGDLIGTNTSQTVVSLTGSGSPGIVDILAGRLRFSSSVLNPTINQAATSVAAGQNTNIQAQNSTFNDPAAYGGSIVIFSGSSNFSRSGSTALAIGASSTFSSSIILDGSHISNNQRVLSLVNSNGLDNSQMSADTGDMVIYIHNAATSPTTGDPVDGAILYAENEKLRVKQGNSEDFLIGSLSNPCIWESSKNSSDGYVFKYQSMNESIGVAPASVIKFYLNNDSVAYVNFYMTCLFEDVNNPGTYHSYRINILTAYYVDGSGTMSILSSDNIVDEEFTAFASWIQPSITAFSTPNYIEIFTGADSSGDNNIKWRTNIEINLLQI